MHERKGDARIRLDLNNPEFQHELFGMPKPERHVALDTLDKLRRDLEPALPGLRAEMG